MADCQDSSVPIPNSAVLAAYGLAGAPLRRFGAGLINETWLAGDPTGTAVVLQRLHPVFPALVNEDIDAVTRYLAEHGLPTPRVVRTVAGSLWVEHDGQVWRALTYVPGVSRDFLGSPDEAREAGGLLGRFHRALSGCRYEFRNTRPGVHELARHLGALRAALTEKPEHPRFAAIEPLAETIFAVAGSLPPLPATRPRIVHGDPKVNNVLFTPDGRRALCLVDLDTLGRLPICLELGDAFRSWCNPAGEDRAAASFSLELFEAALGGYAAGAQDLLDDAEAGSIVAGTETIYVELAARFCADALHERYFGWDPSRFPSRSEHNQVRAESQLTAARALMALRNEALTIVNRIFARRGTAHG